MGCQNLLALHNINPYIHRDGMKWIGSTRYAPLTTTLLWVGTSRFGAIKSGSLESSAIISSLVTHGLPEPVSTS
jgi:hypothetical protein